MTSPTIYDIGTVTLTNGSAEVSGDGTAWAINGVVGGVFSCGGMSVPIASVDDDETLTLAYPWPGSNASDVAYAISLINSQAADTIWANRHWSRVVGQALLAALRPDASGTLAERDALNPQLANGQWFARAEPPHDLEFYRKVPGGWHGPFATRGVGGVGEGGLGIPSPGAANKMPYYSAADTISLADLTPFARTLLDDANGAAMYATMGQIPNGQLPPRIRASLAGAGTTADANTLNETGWYFLLSGSTNLPNGIAGNLYIQVISQNLGTACKQIAYSHDTHRSWTRCTWYAGGVWTPWVETTANPGSSLAASGYQALPSGLLVQWGVSAVASGDYTQAFPLAFPTACRCVVGSVSYASLPANAAIGVSIDTFTTTNFTVRKRVVTAGSVITNTTAYPVAWFAVGH